MLSATRLLVREARMPTAARFAVGSESASISRRVGVQATRSVRNAARKSVEKMNRRYKVDAIDAAEEQARITFQNNPPAQPAVLTVESLTNVTPEYEHLRQFLPAVILDEELAVVESRVRNAKSASKRPYAADCLWLMLAYLKANKMDTAMVAWNDLVSMETPDVLHWNLMFVHLARVKKFSQLGEVYENFKLAVIKRRLPGPVPVTYSVLLKAFSESGDLERVLQIYEDFFTNRWIPELNHLRCIAKAAALAGEPKVFGRFMARLKHKGVKLNRELIKAHIDIWGRYQVSADTLKKGHVTTADYSQAISYSLRVRNYRRAYELIRECRDVVGIQPDACMYETVLTAMINDGFLRERARALKRRFHKYPKGIEVREEHFEFNALFDEVLALLGKSANNATPADVGEQIRLARTTRKQSGRLYSARTHERYVSGWEFDEFEWVPEYVQRKKELQLAQEQAAKAEELQNIIKKAKSQTASL